MSEAPPIDVGRYVLHRKIARGGMATIHIARVRGDVGFSRIVAAKRLHPELAEDSEFVAMFLDEARIASKVHHRNVVPVLDVVTLGSEVVLVQEYVHGAPLSLLLRNAYAAKAHVPIPVAATLACQVLAGLHAAHSATDELGTALHIVHRDVSPQNVMVATDGSARLLDFGVAKASFGAHITRKGTFKGKLAYSSPEQIRGEASPQSDVYSLAVVLWELLVGHRLHVKPQGETALIAEIMGGELPTITEALTEERSWIGSYRWSQLEALEPIIRKGLDVQPRRRWSSAAEMEEAIAAAVPLASAADVEAWLWAVGKDFLDDRERMIAAEEASWRRAESDSDARRRGSSYDEALPVSTATEPELRRGIVVRRGPTALIVVLVALLGASIAFLRRDLETTSRTPDPVAHDPASAPMEPVRAVTVEREPPPPAEPAADETVPAAAAAPTPPVEPRPPKHVRIVRATKPPPRPTPTVVKPPPPPTKAVDAPDCGTPFYFEGRKKIFKPGCL